MEPVKIAFAINRDYASILYVTIRSLVMKASMTNEYEINVITEHIPDNRWQMIMSLQKENIRIHKKDISEFMSASKLGKVGYQSMATYYRLFLGKIFPNDAKVLYLDSDMIINRDVAELFFIDLGESVFGVCNDYLRKWNRKYIDEQLGIEADDYFNAGLLLINLAKFRENRIGEKCIDMLGEGHKYLMADQDALNIVSQKLDDRVKPQYLDRRWNVIWEVLTIDENDPFEGENISDNYKKIIDDPYIIHYTSKRKPWNHPEYQLARYFWDAARETPVYEELLIKGSENRGKERTADEAGLFEKFRFPWEKISFGEKVVLYGAGACGKSFFKQMQLCGYCDVVAMCDRNYLEYKSYPLPVIDPDKIDMFEYDKLVISIEDEGIARKIIEAMSQRISPRIIVWDDYKRKM